MRYSVEELGLVDAPPEGIFDNLTTLATSLFGIPVSLVSIVDFETDRQFFKSHCGLPEPLHANPQTPLSHSFCQHVVKDNRTLVVEDAVCHEKVKDNPAIEQLGVATYLGAPIYNNEDEPIGAFCVIGMNPRLWTSEEIRRLEQLSCCVTDAIKLKASYLDSEALRREQADFTYAISHELKSPANTLQLIFEEIAQERDLLSEDVGNLVTDGLGTVQRMQNQMEDILHYSQTTDLRKADELILLQELIDDIQRDLRADMEACGAIIQCEQIPAIAGDRMQIRALFQNLISNALKFRAADRTPVIKIGHERGEAGYQHVISVEDNGIGIAKKHQTSIFQLFTRLHLQSSYSGTGIGLALCHRVMQNHNGKISVVSNGKDGSTFTLCFTHTPS